jgi:F-type H+-transporting ATPase subunit alpha
MQLNPSEISELIKSKIENLAISADLRTQGTVVSVTDGICRVYGLTDVMQGEMLEFPGNTFGMALNLDRDSVGAVVLGEYEQISEGDTVKTTGRILEVPVGPGTAGPRGQLARSADRRQGPDQHKLTDKIEKVAPGVIWRKSVSQPVQTGLKSIDAMVPIGRGQRELIIGDRQTGKTAIAVDTIINQKGKNLICIYVAVGQKAFDGCQRRAQARRESRDGIHHRRGGDGLRIGADAVHGTLLRRTMGEYFRDNGKHALIMYDDLTKQAGPIVSCPCCCAVRRAVKPIRATCSICTPACWSGSRRSNPQAAGAWSSGDRADEAAAVLADEHLRNGRHAVCS